MEGFDNRARLRLRARHGLPASLFALALTACAQDLGLDRLRFACRTDQDCVRGTVCDPVRQICLAAHEVTDGGVEADGGLDADAALPQLPGCPDAGTATAAARVVQLVLGRAHSCARTDDGLVRCWGANDHGQLGLGLVGPPRAAPALVPGLCQVTEVSAGHDHTCALQANGEVRCWGKNKRGQVGAAVLADITSPTLRPVVSGAVQIAAGLWQSSCARTRDGRVFCWGYSLNGQDWIASDDQGTNDYTPRLITGFRPGVMSSLSLGAYTACVIIDGGDLVDCWGANYHGQVGDGTRENSVPAPTPALLGPGVTQVGPGDRHGCAVEGGQAKCWGEASLVDFSQALHPAVTTPVVIPLGGEVAEIYASYRHTCARTVDGRVLCWGESDVGQSGVATSTSAREIVGVAGRRVERLFVGWSHNCVILDDDEIRCWGANDSFQLGRLTPGTSTPEARAVIW